MIVLVQGIVHRVPMFLYILPMSLIFNMYVFIAGEILTGNVGDIFNIKMGMQLTAKFNDPRFHPSNIVIETKLQPQNIYSSII